MNGETADSLSFDCPGCGEALRLPIESAGQLTRCPYCSTQFFASPGRADLDIVDDTEDVDHAEPAAELDGNRIRQVAALRRGAIRARSWCQIGAAAGAVVAVELLFKTVQNVAHSRTVNSRAIGFTLFAIVSATSARMMLRSARRLTAEINAPRDPGDTVEPDFATLSDGSQRWSNLNDIR